MFKVKKTVARYRAKLQRNQHDMGGLTWNAVPQTEKDMAIYDKKLKQLAPYGAAMKIRIADCRKEEDHDRADKMQTMLAILEKRRYVGLDYLKSLESWILSNKDYLMKENNNQVTNSSADVDQIATSGSNLDQPNQGTMHASVTTKRFSTVHPPQQVSGYIGNYRNNVVVPISAPVCGHTESAEMAQNRSEKWQRAMDGISLVNYPGSNYKDSTDCDEQEELEELRQMKANTIPHIKFDNPKKYCGGQSLYQANVRLWRDRHVSDEELEYIEDKDTELKNPGDTTKKEITGSFENCQSLEKNVEEWSPSEVSIFEESMFQCKKNFAEVQISLPNKTVGECVKFYYSWKKTSPDAYAKLKNNLRDQRNLEEQTHNSIEADVTIAEDCLVEDAEEKCTKYVKMTEVQNKVKSLENFYTSFNKLTHAVEDVAVSHSQLSDFYNAKKITNTYESDQEKEKTDCMLATLGDALKQIDAVVTKTSKKLEMFPDPRKTTRKIQKIMKSIKDNIKEAGYMDDIANYVSLGDNLDDSDYFEDTLLESFPDLGNISTGNNIASVENAASQTMTVIHPKIQYHDIEVETDQSAKHREFTRSLDFYDEFVVEVPAGCHTGLVLFPIKNEYSYTHIIDEVIEGSRLAYAVDVDLILKKELITVNGKYVKNINTLQVVEIIRDFCAVGGILLLGVLHEPFSIQVTGTHQKTELEKTELNKKIEEHKQFEEKMKMLKMIAQKQTELTAGSKNHHISITNTSAINTNEENPNSAIQEQQKIVDEELIDSDDSITGSEDSSRSDSDSSDSDSKYEAIEAKMVKNHATSQIAETVERQEHLEKTLNQSLHGKLDKTLEIRKINNECATKNEDLKSSDDKLSSDGSTTDSDSDESSTDDDSDDLESDPETTDNEDSADESDSTSSDEDSSDSDSDSSHLNDADNKSLEEVMAALRRRQQDGIKEDEKIQLEKQSSEPTITPATEPLFEKNAPVVPIVIATAPTVTMFVEKDQEIAKQDTVDAKNTKTTATESGFALAELLILVALIVNAVVLLYF